MGTYKQFNSQDIIVSPLEVNKTFSFEGDALTGSDVGIDRFVGITGSFLEDQTTTGLISGEEEYKVLIFNSIKHLYYSNYLSGSNGWTSFVNTASFNTDGTITGPESGSPTYNPNFYNYEQNTVYPNKDFTTSSIGVISIPSKLFGDYIQPGSFNFTHTTSGSITDDGEGRLLFNGNVVGNIIYQHGLAIITGEETISAGGGGEGSLYGEATYGDGIYGDESRFIDFLEDTDVTCSFLSSYTIFETQYKCTIGEDEFNYTSNPTILSGSEGYIYNQYTGSYFQPYITTIGLYNEAKELIAIGKLAKPLPSSRNSDTTVLINIDR